MCDKIIIFRKTRNGQTIEPSVFNFIVQRHFDELKDKEFVIIPMQNDLDRKIKFGENVDKNAEFA